MSEKKMEKMRLKIKDLEEALDKSNELLAGIEDVSPLYWSSVENHLDKCAKLLRGEKP